MAQYAPLRDAFSDFTKLLVDKQEWDARREADNDRRQRENMILQSQLQDSALRRKSLEREAAREQERMRPVEVNIYDVVPNNDYTRTKLNERGGEFARLMGGSQVDWATGRVMDDNGSPIKLASWLKADRSAKAYGVLSADLDPEEMINENLTFVNSRRTEVQKEYDSTPLSDVSKRKQLKERLVEIGKVQNDTQGMLEPSKLIPFYRQRSEQLNQLIMNVASEGGDPALLQSLQGAAQRANQDFLALQQRQMTIEQQRYAEKIRSEDKRELEKIRSQDRAEARASRLEERRIAAEARLEEKRLKAEEGKTPQQHTIVRKDDKGNIVDSAVINVPKITRGFVIEEVDPRFKREEGWQLLDQAKQTESNQKGTKLNATGASGMLEEHYKIAADSDNPLARREIPVANQPRFIASQKILGDYLKTSANEAEAASKAFQEIVNAETAYWEMFDAQTTGIKDPKDIAKLEEALAELYAEDYGYKPQQQHRLTLNQMLGTMYKGAR